MAIIISHTAIIDKQGRILVLRRSASEKVLPGFWDFPGGTVKLKEDPAAGAIREVKEECGLRVSGLRLLACTSNWDRKKQENFVTLIFITKKYSGRVKLNHRDHEEYAWLTKKELKTIKAVEYFPKILKLL
jgi:8-oxo-dGTP diphosphatase